MCSLLSRSSSRGPEPVRQLLERGQPRIGRPDLAGAGGDIPVSAADGAEPAAVRPAEGLHREPQLGLRLQQPADVEEIVDVEIHLEIVGRELDLLAPRRTRAVARVHPRHDIEGKQLEAAPAGLGHTGAHPAPDQDVGAILLYAEGQILEDPGRILEGVRELRKPFDRKAFLRDFRHLDVHGDAT
jgi:hypothetical protein